MPTSEVETRISSPAVSGQYLDKGLRPRLWRVGRRLRKRCQAVCCIWKSAFRSFLGHIRTQSTTVIPYTDFGPVLRRTPDGCLAPEKRTQVRSRCTSTLEATYPWLDQVDRKLFLMGFDAGEQWGRDSSDTGE